MTGIWIWRARLGGATVKWGWSKHMHLYPWQCWRTCRGSTILCQITIRPSSQLSCQQWQLHLQLQQLPLHLVLQALVCHAVSFPWIHGCSAIYISQHSAKEGIITCQWWWHISCPHFHCLWCGHYHPNPNLQQTPNSSHTHSTCTCPIFQFCSLQWAWITTWHCPSGNSRDWDLTATEEDPT